MTRIRSRNLALTVKAVAVCLSICTSTNLQAQAAPKATAPPAIQKPVVPNAPTAPRVQASPVIPPASTYRFPNGQTLHYVAEWRLFNAGTATLRMDAAGREQRILATADAMGAVGLLYHVHDRIETFLDAKTFCALSLHKHTEEGLRRLETEVTFDQARKKSVLSEKNLRNKESKHVETDTPGCLEDVLTAVYYVGSLPLAPGIVHHFPLNDGGKTTDVKVTVEARENVKTPAGTFKTVRVQPTAEAGLIKNRGQIWLWYSDDGAHIPVQMKARLFWGTLSFQLERIEMQPQR